MAVRLVLGRAGTGKSKLVYDAIVDAARADPMGPPIFLILPKQATFQAQRELVAGLGGFTRVHVLSFDLLGEEILEHCGDVGLPEVTPLGRRLVLGHLLRRHRDGLKFFTRSAATPGLTAELDATFAEFDRGGVDVAKLDELLAAVAADPAADPSLVDKLTDVRLVMATYNAFIGGGKIDPSGRLKRVMARVADCDFFKRSLVFVDEFFDFTRHELDLLTAVAGAAAETTVTLLLDPVPRRDVHDLSIFHRTERTHRSLLRCLHDKGVGRLPDVALAEPVRFKSAALAIVERCLFESDRMSPESATGFDRFEATDLRSEVDAVARRIKSAVSNGARYRDVAVLVRDLSAYRPEVAASFAEHDIPFFADVRRPAVHHPVLLAARAALLIARYGWPHDAVMALVKTGLTGLTDAEADDVENYALHHRVRGKRWEAAEPWVVVEAEAFDEDGAAPRTPPTSVDAVRAKLVDGLRPLLASARSGGPRTVRQWTADLFDSLQRLGVPTVLAGWIDRARRDGKLERAGEHEQVWSELTDFFTQAVELLGDQDVSLADFIVVVDSALEGFDLALTPQTVDQVIVGQVDRTRPPAVTDLFVLGLNEGEFPRPARDDSLLSDRDRRQLRDRLVDLDQESDRLLLDERFLGYLAFTRGSRRLTVSRHKSTPNGRPTAPSVFWTELGRLLPGRPIESIPAASTDHPDQVATPRQMLAGLMRWVRHGADSADPVWAAVYQWFAGSDPSGEVVRRRGRHAWAALTYRNDADLSADVTGRLFPTPLRASVAQLETFAACPFRHFARYGLRLGTRESPNVTSIDLNNAYHRILEGAVSEMSGRNGSWSHEASAGVVGRHTTRVAASLRGDILLGDARNRYLHGRIERQAGRAMAAVLTAIGMGSLRPDQTTLEFGPNKPIPPLRLTTASGDVVELSGRVDRVDRIGTGSEVIVVDYRLRVNTVPLDMTYHGLKLQLFSSALALRNQHAVAGVLEWPILTTLQSVAHPSDAVPPDDPHFLIRDKPRGAFDAAHAAAFQRDFVGGASAVVAIQVNKNGELGRRESTDAVTADELAGLLALAEEKLGELAAGVLSGRVAVAPYMMGTATPCGHCEYRSVCRFEPGVNRYRVLPRIVRTQVLEMATGGVR